MQKNATESSTGSVDVESTEEEGLAARLAERVTSAYFDEVAARQRIFSAVSDLSEFDGSAFTTEQVAAAIAEELDAALPASWDGRRPKQTDVQRSELGEIIAAEVLSTLFSTVVPASRVSTKETPDQQSRGADVLGLEDTDGERVTLVLAEVKGSTDASSPPGVLQDMETKLLQLARERRILLQELMWLRDHSSDEWAPLCARICAAYLLKRSLFRVLLAPVLVRSRSVLGDSDYGRFESQPDRMGERVRFIRVIVERDLFDFASEVYLLARERLRNESE